MIIEPDSLCLCGACGRRARLLFADCLSRGWPECCGQTMTVIATPRAPASAPTEREDGAATHDGGPRLATT